MKIAIHHRPGSFSERWIAYCKREGVEYKIVNAYDNDIVKQVRDCDAFMWHHDHNNYKDLLTAKKILFALEHSGKIVYPNFTTGWHFDDKVAQKYLLEAIDAPLVPSYVFYDKIESLEWIRTASFPKVFKLKGGSGSSNVILLESQSNAEKIINKSFGQGIPIHSYSSYVKEKWRHFSTMGYDIRDLLKIVYRFFSKGQLAKHAPRERDYVYFQEFIPNNDHDIRIVVVGDKAAGEKRFVRKNDFRASGSGEFSYEGIDIKVVEVAFEISERLKLQSAAFDFIFDDNNNPLIVEISYGFGIKGISNVPGYWDKNLIWHEGKLHPEEWMIEDLIKSI